MINPLNFYLMFNYLKEVYSLKGCELRRVVVRSQSAPLLEIGAARLAEL